MGKALQGHRQQAVIATKFGNTFDETSRKFMGLNVSPEYIRSACEASLRRLNTDCIDLYQQHRNEYPAEQSEAIRDTLEALVAEGKIRSYGWSTDFIDRAKFFADGKHCTAIQHEMNVMGDKPAMITLCETHNLASILRGPLAMGVLTGKFTAETTFGTDDVRSGGQEGFFIAGKPNPDYLNKLEALRDILTSGGRTLAQGALAWLLARSEKNIPIPGFKSVKQVEENCGVLHLGALTVEQMQQIDSILGREPVISSVKQ